MMLATVFLLLVGAGIAALPIFLLFRGVKRGVWNGRGVNIHRSENPMLFWFGIVMYGVIAAVILSFPLYVVWSTFWGP